MGPEITGNQSSIGSFGGYTYDPKTHTVKDAKTGAWCFSGKINADGEYCITNANEKLNRADRNKAAYNGTRAFEENKTGADYEPTATELANLFKQRDALLDKLNALQGKYGRTKAEDAELERLSTEIDKLGEVMNNLPSQNGFGTGIQYQISTVNKSYFNDATSPSPF